MNKVAPADPLSALIQLQARRHGVELRWTNKGIEDLILLTRDTSNKTILSKQLWDGIKEIWEMPAVKELPEPVYAKLCSIILKARALADMEMGKRDAKCAAPLGVPTEGRPA